MYQITKNPAEPEGSILASQLKIGELAEVTAGYTGQIVVQTFAGVISLSDPNQTWERNATLEVKRLPRGTVVQLAVIS